MRVAISVINGEGYGRQVARGVVDYARPRPDWQFFSEHFGFLEPVMDMQKWRGDGAIILCGADRARPLARRRIPIVNVSTSSEPIYLPAVIPDNLQVGRIAAKAFLEDGFRRLAYVKYFDFFFSRQRGEGFAAAAAEAGVEVLRPDYEPRGRDGFDGSSSELRALGRWLSRQEYPLGVFAASDQRASQVIKATQLAGLQVPEQVAVIGVDNDDIGCDVTRPRLSSVDVNAREIGYRAAELLDAMMHGAPAPKEPILVPPLGLVRRASSDILAVEDAELAAAMKFIRDHVGQSTTVDDVLDSVGISRSSLERKFHKHLGRTPLEEIRRVHVEAARDLLVHTYTMGYEAGRLLRQVMEGKGCETVTVPPLGLVERGSTALVWAGDVEVAAAMEYIWQNIEKQLTVEDVLENVPVSRSTLERKFREHLDRTPAQEIQRSRLETARRLLTSSKLNLASVAIEAGYPGQSAMGRALKAATGLTPRAYRQQFRTGKAGE